MDYLRLQTDAGTSVSVLSVRFVRLPHEGLENLTLSEAVCCVTTADGRRLEGTVCLGSEGLDLRPLRPMEGPSSLPTTSVVDAYYWLLDQESTLPIIELPVEAVDVLLDAVRVATGYMSLQLASTAETPQKGLVS